MTTSAAISLTRITTRPRSKNPERVITVRRYIGGWDITLGIGHPDHARALAAATLTPEQATELGHALVAAATAATETRPAT